MNNFLQKFILAMACVLICNVTYALGNIDNGKLKSQPCITCHGTDGNSENPAYPKIAAQNHRYLIEQLLDFQQGPKSGRDNPIMQGMVANLSPQDIEDLAYYFESQSQTIGKADPNLIAAGQALFRGGNLQKGIPACMACHGPRGKGNGQAGFPLLGGQHPEYIISQLNAYKSGTRHNDINAIMQNIAAKLSDNDIKAVASYISGLH